MAYTQERDRLNGNICGNFLFYQFCEIYIIKLCSYWNCNELQYSFFCNTKRKAAWKVFAMKKVNAIFTKIKQLLEDFLWNENLTQYNTVLSKIFDFVILKQSDFCGVKGHDNISISVWNSIKFVTSLTFQHQCIFSSETYTKVVFVYLDVLSFFVVQYSI